MTNVQLFPSLPSLEEARKIIKGYKRPLNHSAFILQVVAPAVNSSGMQLGKSAQEEAQRLLNQKGMLVVASPFDHLSKKDVTNSSVVFSGETVLFAPDSPASFMTTIKTNKLIEGLNLPENMEVKPEMYQSYVLICMSVHNFSCVVDHHNN